MDYDVAMLFSGGVDSVYATHLLKKQGKKILLVYLRLTNSNFEATWSNLQFISRHLRLPLIVFDMRGEFRRDVIDYSEKEYRLGRTPNPCVMCNSLIKFGRAFERIREMGIAYVASGHYASVHFDTLMQKHAIGEDRDSPCSQSYFLYAVSPLVLKYTVFPLSTYLKRDVVSEVNRLYPLLIPRFIHSRDVCFRHLLCLGNSARKGVSGPIINESGYTLGWHRGIEQYTVGQRRKLGIAHDKRLYVKSIEPVTRKIVVAPKDQVMSKKMAVRVVNWFSVLKRQSQMLVKIRYNAPKVPATVAMGRAGMIIVDFVSPQFAITPGQSAVFYRDSTVVGGGIIENQKDNW